VADAASMQSRASCEIRTWERSSLATGQR
jgi:hypothetical protein